MGNNIKMKQKRIFEIAKELNISHIEITQFLKKEKVPFKSIMTSVNDDIYMKILEEFAKEKDIVERIKKEKARKSPERSRIQTEIYGRRQTKGRG